MKLKNLFRILAMVALLAAGWLLFRTLNAPVTTVQAEDSFRVWLWENRGLDLVVQMILVFAGTLGIAAILPGEEDEDD